MAERAPPTAPEARAKPARTRAAAIALATSYAGLAISIVKGILLVPLYLRFFGLDLYGAFLASASVVGLLGILDAGLGGVINQSLAESWGAGDSRRFSRIAGAAAALMTCVAGALILAGLALSRFVPALVNAPAGSASALSITFVLCSVAAASDLLLGSLLAVSAAWQLTRIAASSRLPGQLLETAVIVVALLSGAGVLSLGLGALAGAVSNLGIALVLTSLRWRALGLPRLGLERGELRTLGTRSLPLLLGRIALQVDANIEVALVSAFVSPAAASIYALTDRIIRLSASFLNQASGSVSSGLAHFIGERGRREAIRPIREVFALWSVAVAIVFPSLLALNQDFTALWVGPANYGGIGLNLALVGSEVLGARELLSSIVLISSGAFRAAALLQLAEVLTRLPLMFLGLRLLGPIGMPIATAGVSLASLVLYRALLNERLDLPAALRWSLHTQGALALSLSLSLGVIGALFWPHALTWPQLVFKGSVVGLVHLGLAFAFLPAGRAAVARRVR